MHRSRCVGIDERFPKINLVQFVFFGAPTICTEGQECSSEARTLWATLFPARVLITE